MGHAALAVVPDAAAMIFRSADRGCTPLTAAIGSFSLPARAAVSGKRHQGRAAHGSKPSGRNVE